MTTTIVDRLAGVAEGLASKAACRAATTANIVLSGLQTIDGVALNEGDRVLVKNQSDTTTNGIYVASTGLWKRAADFDGSRDAITGTKVLIVSGTVSGLTEYMLTTVNPVTFGTSAITFALVPTDQRIAEALAASQAAAVVAQSANNAAVAAGIAISNAILAVNNAQAQGVVGFTSKANMDANLAYPAGTLAFCYDADPAKRGQYIKSGASGAGSWTRQADLPVDTAIGDLNSWLVQAARIRDLSGPILATGEAYTFALAGYGGIACPFAWDGTAFDVVEVAYAVDQIGYKVRVAIWNAAGTGVFAFADFIPSQPSGRVRLQLSQRVSTAITLDSPLRISISVPVGGVDVGVANVPFWEDVADTTTYPQKAWAKAGTQPATVSIWSTVSARSAIIPFALYDSQSTNYAGAVPPYGIREDQAILPPRLYGQIGKEANFYFDGMTVGRGQREWDAVPDSTLAPNCIQFDECVRVTPTAARTNRTITFNCYDPDRETIRAFGTARYDAVARDATGGHVIPLLTIGDSHTQFGAYLRRMLDRSAENPLGVQYNLLGTRGTAPVKHEGVAGIQAGQWYGISGIFGDGSPNRFRTGGVFDAATYAAAAAPVNSTAMGGLAGVQPKVLLIHLGHNAMLLGGGVNDYSAISAAYAEISYIDYMLGIPPDTNVPAPAVGTVPFSTPWGTAPGVYAGGTRVIICFPMNSAYHQDAMGYGSYGLSGTTLYRFRRNQRIFNAMLRRHFAPRFADGIILVGLHICNDPFNGYKILTARASATSEWTVNRQFDAVHPDPFYLSGAASGVNTGYTLTLSSTAGLAANMSCMGLNVASNNYVVSVDSPTQVTLALPHTGTVTNVTFMSGAYCQVGDTLDDAINVLVAQGLIP